MTAAKERAKERDGYQCVFCGTTRDEHKEIYGRDLAAHHIIKDRDNGADDQQNYITVCRSCHHTIERSQADALSQLRENILSESEESLKNHIDELHARCDSLHDWIEDVESNKGSGEVRVGHYYKHSLHGDVYVKSLDSELVGCDENGAIKQYAVNYSVTSSNDDLVLTEYYEEFNRYTSKGFESSHELKNAHEREFKR